MLATEHLEKKRGVSGRKTLLDRMSRARKQSDALFSIIRPDSLYERPIPERHRVIFYIGHLEAFDWNLLHGPSLGLKSFDPTSDRLFAFGIDPVAGGLPTDKPSDWPSIEKVREYVSHVRSSLDNCLTEGDWADGRDGFPLDTLLHVAVEHRLMHLETLAYMLHQLPLSTKIKQEQAQLSPASAPEHQSIEIPAGRATLGLARQNETFGWDNEYEVQSVYVPEFAIDKFPVTNQQFLEFMRVGGYETREFWSDSDWEWKKAQGIRHPVCWKPLGDDKWLYRTMFEEIPLPKHWPVYVSHAEASAYARWAGKSLPTEGQWHRAAYGTAEGKERTYPWGEAEPSSRKGNFDFQSWDPMPVNAHPEGASAFGVEDMTGNGWDWTASIFGPFPGFEPFPFYRGYSADFFDGKHFVMKGGSARTAQCMLRSSFRNWFQPRYQYVYAGFRCVSC